jgi:hypothetical protein
MRETELRRLALRLLASEFPAAKEDGARLLKILSELLLGLYGPSDGDHPLKLRR